MASNPGVLTDWPWKHLGSFKYVILAPWVVHSIYSFTIGENERDLTNFLMFAFILTRMLHNQIWISFSRHRTAKGNSRIVDKSIEFEQVDRESNWDDQILLNGILFYVVNMTLPGASHLPLWRTDGVISTILLHMGPVEFLYYWFHRALHHHYLYSRYHSHHHSSIVTEPITSSLAAVFGYVTYIDFMNNMGHCNFEVIPKWIFSIFPPLKYFMYTPSFHSLHHTQFRSNYSLFMPIYDYIYNTVDKSTERVYETTLKRPEELPDVVHLTHLTTPESIYHIRLGFASLASRPLTSIWYLWVMWPVTCWSIVLARFYGRTFVVERNPFKKVISQTWVIPKYNIQYFVPRQMEVINSLIEEAILEAEERGVKVLSLGLLNQGDEFNRYGELYVHKHPKLKIKVVDGSSLAAAVVLNSIPKGTTKVLFRGNLTKVANAIVSALRQREIQVTTLQEDEYKKLRFSNKSGTNLVVARSYDQMIWLVGDGVTEKEQMKALKGTLFIPFSQFPPKKVRRDCFYHNTPAMMTPISIENMHSCENWLPRRVMSAWRVAGIIHALEEWNVQECGHTMFSIDKVWQASLQHGFRPLSTTPTPLNYSLSSV